MRLLYAVFPLLLSSGLSAQVFTYYSVPPTSGCNGVWAVQILSFYCGTAPYTFTMTPNGCMDLNGWTNDQDTLFLPLCAFPCQVDITTADGVTCSGSTTPSANNVAENPEEVQLSVLVQGTELEVNTPLPLPAGVLRILDLTGRTYSSTSTEPGQQWRLALPTVRGTYVVAMDAGDTHVRERFLVTR